VARRLATDHTNPGWPAEALERIDIHVQRRTRRSAGSNLAAHLRALDEAADIDVSAPTASTRSIGRGVKVAISRATGWYIGHIAAQVRHLGVATARAVRATAAQVDDLEQRVRALEDATDAPEHKP
jgi:hypothetical protein